MMLTTFCASAFKAPDCCLLGVRRHDETAQRGKHLTAWLEILEEDKSLDMQQLYLIGSSLGGASLIPVLNDYDAKALITLSAGRSSSSETEMALSSSMTKTYFVATKNDPLGANVNALEYGKKAIAGTTLILSGDGHGTVLLPKVQKYIFLFIELSR